MLQLGSAQPLELVIVEATLWRDMLSHDLRIILMYVRPRQPFHGTYSGNTRFLHGVLVLECSTPYSVQSEVLVRASYKIFS